MDLTLSEKRTEFSRTFAYFEVWCHEQGYPFWSGEAFRPAFVAEHYAKTGKGIKNSNHRKYLARDLFRVVNGAISWNFDDYIEMGAKWKSMHPLARWGGDFKSRDAVHFSFIHNGVM